jgi:hypothetical protein
MDMKEEPDATCDRPHDVNIPITRAKRVDGPVLKTGEFIVIRARNLAR